MKIIDIIQNSGPFSFYIRGSEIAAKVTDEFKKLGYGFENAEMENIFTECVAGRSHKYRFQVVPKKKIVKVQPAYGTVSTEDTSLENPVFSQNVMMFMFWLLKNEGSI